MRSIRYASAVLEVGSVTTSTTGEERLNPRFHARAGSSTSTGYLNVLSARVAVRSLLSSSSRTRTMPAPITSPIPAPARRRTFRLDVMEDFDSCTLVAPLARAGRSTMKTWLVAIGVTGGAFDPALAAAAWALAWYCFFTEAPTAVA